MILAAALSATLDLFPAKTNPAVRPAIRVTLKNESRSMVSASAKVKLYVDWFPAGEDALDNRPAVTLAPHESREYWFIDNSSFRLPELPRDHVVWMEVAGTTTNRVIYTVDENAPAEPLPDIALYHQAMSLWNRADSSMQRRRLEPALALAKEARVMLERLVATTTIAPLRSNAAATLPLTTEQQMVTHFYSYFARSDEGVRERVVPIADCVEPLGDGRFIARFGFTNPNFGGKYVPIGLANWMEPEPKDAGQPVWIWPSGTRHRVAEVKSDGGPVTWHLDGHVAEATIESPRCTGSR